MENKSFTRRRFVQGVAGLSALGAAGSLLPFSSRLMAADLPRPGEGDWTRYGYDLHNTRFNPKEKTIGPKNVDRLKVKWQFPTVDHWFIQSVPTVIGDTLFFGAGGWYYALESATGKLKWKYEAPVAGDWMQSVKNRSVRSSCEYVDGRIYFGDGRAIVHCVDAATGKAIWQTPMEEDPRMSASMVYSPVVYRGKVFVGYTARNARIACLDAETGAIRWSWRVAQSVAAAAKSGGGPLWTSGAIDEKYNILYNATGDAKTFMEQDGTAGPILYTASMVAHDADTGELLWYFQPYPQDAADIDFDAHPIVYDAEPPMFVKGDVRHCVVAGCKSGIFCCNRYTGELYWKVMLGPKSAGGGPQTDAIAYAYNKVYVAYTAPTAIPPMSLTAALNAYNGDIEWMTQNETLTRAPLAVANGVLYQGLFAGKKFEALDAMTGRKLWEFDMPSFFKGGAAIANGAVYMGSGNVGVPDPSMDFFMYGFTIDGK